MTAVSDVATRNLAVERVAVDRLRPHPRNPRRIRPERLEQLKRSLEAEPEMLDARPLIALPDGTVVAGNQRLLAAVALGWESIPVVFADLTAERATEWMLRDNQGYGEQLAELAAAGGDLDLTGYEPGAVDALLRAAARRDVDPDEAPPLPAEARSRLGEVYELGPHRLMCGDATDAAQVLELLGDEEPTLLVTDPPYGVELDAEWRDRAGLNPGAPAEPSYLRANGKSADTRADWSDAFALVESIMAAYIWHASAFTVEIKAGLERIGFQHFQQIIWDKGMAMRTRTHYWFAHEPCWYARKPRAPWHGRGGTENATVWRAHPPKYIFGGDGEERFAHPTQKPVALALQPLLNHLRRGEIVYEPFAGSGTTVIAAEQTGRRCFAMEIDPRYVDVIRDRYAAFVA